MASCGYYGQRADRIGFGSYTPDPTYRIRFISVLPQESMDYIAQNRPGLVRVWPNTSGQETSRCAGIIVPGFWKDATSPLPVSHLLTPFRSSTDNIVQSQPGSVLVLADSIGFWPNGSGPEESQCVRIIRPASGQCFPADPDRMRIGPDMFAGISIVLAWWCRHF